MPLTNIQIQKAVPKDKAYKLYDGNGLFLHVLKSGKKVWRYRFTFNKKEKALSLGAYPAVSSKKARELRDAAYVLIVQGIDPAQAKQERKKLEVDRKKVAGVAFKKVALEWCDYKASPNTKRCWKITHKNKVIKSLYREAFPLLGDLVIHTITDDDIDAVIQPILERGSLEIASRVLHRVSSIFRYGKYKKYCQYNPADGREEFLPHQKVKHMAYIAEHDLPKFLVDLDNYQGDFVCKKAVEFVLLTHVRTNEIRFARWVEFDFKAKLWNIPAERMKMPVAQTVPLSDAAIALLEALHAVTSDSEYVFASLSAMRKPISENGMLSVIYRMGYKGKTTIHGLRATFSTIANETLKFRRDVVEAALAHKVNDPVRESYCHATYLDERIENAQVWANYLQGLRGK